VLKELAKAEQFRPPLNEFYFAIGGARDRHLQDFIRLLSDDRINDGKFAVHVLFFEDICQQLANDPALIQKYWGDFLRIQVAVEFRQHAASVHRKRSEEAGAEYLADRRVQPVALPAETSLLGKYPELFDYFRPLQNLGDRVYVGTGIPAEKLKNAFKARPAYCRHGKPMLLVDDTVFGSGKDGLLVTDEYASFKSGFSDSHDYWLKHCRSILVPEGFKFGVVPPHQTDAVLRQLQAYLSDRRKWHESAAEQGDRESQFFLSFQYETSDERGAYWLIRAAKAGHVIAQHNLAMEIKAIDRAQAMHWFARAAAQGHELSSQRLTDLRRAGPGADNAEIPPGATRLIAIMCPEAVCKLNRNIKDSHQALRRAMLRILEEEKVSSG
jgi:hypothetical protein